MPNPRIPKLADSIRQIVAEMLERRIKDPRLGFVTVTDVRLTGDAREATIFYTVLGDEQQRAGTAAALESAKGLLRSTVGKQLGLRFAPSLTFVEDATPQAAHDMEELLARVQDSDAELAQHRGAQYAGEQDPYRRPEEDDDQDRPLADDQSSQQAQAGQA